MREWFFPHFWILALAQGPIFGSIVVDFLIPKIFFNFLLDIIPIIKNIRNTMCKKNIIKIGYKAGVMLVPFLAFSNMNFGSTTIDLHFPPSSQEGQQNILISGSMPSNVAVQKLLQFPPHTQQCIIRKMSPQYREAIKQQIAFYRRDPEELVTEIATNTYAGEAYKIMEGPGAEEDKIAAMTAFLNEKAEQNLDLIWQQVQSGLTGLSNVIEREENMEKLD
jgi:hypothetical protein